MSDWREAEIKRLREAVRQTGEVDAPDLDGGDDRLDAIVHAVLSALREDPPNEMLMAGYACEHRLSPIPEMQDRLRAMIDALLGPATPSALTIGRDQP